MEQKNRNKRARIRRIGESEKGWGERRSKRLGVKEQIPEK
jgi:hypothetical protein